MLENKEVDKKFDNGAGEVILDVDAKGNILVSLEYKKELDLDGYAKVKASVGIGAETNIYNIAEKIAAKTSTTFDDKLVAGLKELLGITQ